VITFDNVTKKYEGGKAALEEVSFHINEGEFVFLVGPSGAGKSTAIRLLNRQEKPNSGMISFDKKVVNKLKGGTLARYRRELGIVFQDFKLLNSKTVWENIAFVLEVSSKSSVEIKKSVAYVLDLVGLIDKKDSFPETLSGGEQQRVAIARAIVTEPKVLLADEPTGNLDRNNAWDIIQLLNKINNWGTTVIVATHDQEIVDSLNKRVIGFEAGRVVRDNVGGYHK
jgi:cell division transport system ATP-binding protein